MAAYIIKLVSFCCTGWVWVVRQKEFVFKPDFSQIYFGWKTPNNQVRYPMLFERPTKMYCDDVIDCGWIRYRRRNFFSLEIALAAICVSKGRCEPIASEPQHITKHTILRDTK